MVNKFQAQITILGIQMVWTRDAENALLSCKQDKKVMGETNNKFLEILNLLIQQTTKNLDKRERLKYETMITIHMHQRDIFDQICKLNGFSEKWSKMIKYFCLESVYNWVQEGSVPCLPL